MPGKIINFAAGPSKLPEEVLNVVQGELKSYQGKGLSVMEMSHRGSDYMAINKTAQDTLRELLNIPTNYKILFLQGGGTGLFAAVPLNLLANSEATADYIITGSWSAKAYKEALNFGKVRKVLPDRSKYDDIPDRSTWDLNPNASYVYYCDNETVDGVEFADVPDTNGVPIVADMSSNFLTRQFDITKFGLVYAGAQKNIGPAGVTVVIVREDLIGKAQKICPSVFDFGIAAKENSIYNTPPTFAIYVMGLVFEWTKKEGGVAEMERRSAEKSQLIYNMLENSKGLFSCPVKEHCRSRVNVPFRIAKGDTAVEECFLKAAQVNNMIQLKGHSIFKMYSAIRGGDKFNKSKTMKIGSADLEL